MWQKIRPVRLAAAAMPTEFRRTQPPSMATAGGSVLPQSVQPSVRCVTRVEVMKLMLEWSPVTRSSAVPYFG